jgi:HPt (histidine-containing phosphotransfer) domain-containing protein
VIAVEGTELPILDPAAFERTAGYLTSDVIRSYLNTLAERGAALLEALESPQVPAGKNDERASAAHALAGSAGLLGFARLASTGRRFEHAVQAGASDVQAIADELVATIQATLQEINNRLPC